MTWVAFDREMEEKRKGTQKLFGPPKTLRTDKSKIIILLKSSTETIE